MIKNYPARIKTMIERYTDSVVSAARMAAVHGTVEEREAAAFVNRNTLRPPAHWKNPPPAPGLIDNSRKLKAAKPKGASK